VVIGGTSLAGGVSLTLHPSRILQFCSKNMLSPDGKSRTFGEGANGFVDAEGVGVVLLKPLSQAVADRDRVLAVVKGSSINAGGKTSGYTVPNPNAQAALVERALDRAGVQPGSMGYIEAHGTGTSLGDPIEVEALTQAFRQYTQDRQFCRIGSVKTNIGHLEAAAGVAGVIKLLLMIRAREIPQTLNVKTLNPMIPFEESPFEAALERTSWESRRKGQPLRAGVSSFGFGGANSHAIVEEFRPEDYAVPKRPLTEDSSRLFLLSAKTQGSLRTLLATWRDFTESKAFANASLRDICATLAVGREPFGWRCGFYAEDKAAIEAWLSQEEPELWGREKTVAWAIRAGGSRDEGLARVRPSLLGDPLFERNWDRCMDRLKAHSLSPPEDGAARRRFEAFVSEYVFFRTILDYGLEPTIIQGEGTGFYTALALAEVLSPADALALLLGQVQPGDIDWRRPTTPLFDPVAREVRRRCRFEAGYLRALLSDLQVSREDFAHYVDKARMLIQNQYTFKKYVEEWAKELAAIGLSVEGLLDDRALLASPAGERRHEKLLLLMIIKSSLKRLNQKWNLKPRGRIAESRPRRRRITDDPALEAMLLRHTGEVGRDLPLLLGLLEEADDLPELLATCHRLLVMRGGAVLEEIPAESVTEDDLAHRLAS